MRSLAPPVGWEGCLLAVLTASLFVERYSLGGVTAARLTAPLAAAGALAGLRTARVDTRAVPAIAAVVAYAAWAWKKGGHFHPGDRQPWIHPAEAIGSLFGHARRSAEEEHPPPALRGSLAERMNQVRPGHALRQRPPHAAGIPDERLPVGHNEGGVAIHRGQPWLALAARPPPSAKAPRARRKTWQAPC